ncbi:MAG TPA: DNA oxidative demethylase AlkB [Bryobacteraceae bacterium]|nr:DNA oxidative demethylase AlkB [Bryobacteraceae bacterium]
MLFADLPEPGPAVEAIADGASLLRRFAEPLASDLIAAVEQVAIGAPFRHMITPGGYRMSVAMTNCGPVGWVSDSRGYRYSPKDPTTGEAWPAMPEVFRTLAVNAAAAANFPDFHPDACLINRYEPGTKLSLHQDKDERDFAAPIVSVSLGLPAVFLWGGLKRNDKVRRIRVESGDIAVWGGPSRLTYHGVSPLADGEHPLTGRTRINLTFRYAVG